MRRYNVPEKFFRAVRTQAIRVNTLGFIVALGFLIVPLSSDTQGDDKSKPITLTLTVRAPQGNVRSGPGTLYDVIGIVRQGEKYIAQEHHDDWFKLTLEKGREGWIHQSLVEVLEEPPSLDEVIRDIVRRKPLRQELAEKKEELQKLEEERARIQKEREALTAELGAKLQRQEVASNRVTTIVRSIAFSPDGTILASASSDYLAAVVQSSDAVKLWNVADGRLLRKFTVKDYVWSVAFSPDGDLLAFGAGRGRIELWRVSTGSLVNAFSDKENTIVNSIAFGRDSKVLAYAIMENPNDNPRVELRNLDTSIKTTLRTLGYQKSLAFSPDGKFLAAGGSYKIHLWNSDGSPLRAFGRDSQIDDMADLNSIAFSPDGRTLASGGEGGHLKLWDISTGHMIRDLVRDKLRSVVSVAFSPDGKTLAAVEGRISFVSVYDVLKGSLTKSLAPKPLEIPVTAVSFSPDGRTLATAHGGAIELWDVGRWSLKKKIDTYTGFDFQ